MRQGIAFFSSEPVSGSTAFDYSPFRPETERERQVSSQGFVAAPTVPSTGLIDDEVKSSELQAASVALPLINVITRLTKEYADSQRDGVRPISRLVFDETVRWAQIISKTGLAVATQDQIVWPQVVPTQAGGLQLEWHRKNLDLEIEIGPNGRAQAYLEDAAVDEPIEADLAEGLDRIRGALELVLVR